MGAKRRKKCKIYQLLVGGFLVLIIGAGFFLIKIWPLPHHPNAILIEDCGGRNFNRAKTHGILSINTCFITSEDPYQVWEWYEKSGWFPFGERLVFPGWKIGSVCFEVGNQFHFDYETDYQANEPVKIYQQTLYHFGLCPHGVSPQKYQADK
jgi:hypothetical protein